MYALPGLSSSWPPNVEGNKSKLTLGSLSRFGRALAWIATSNNAALLVHYRTIADLSNAQEWQECAAFVSDIKLWSDIAGDLALVAAKYEFPDAPPAAQVGIDQDGNVCAYYERESDVADWRKKHQAREAA